MLVKHKTLSLQFWRCCCAFGGQMAGQKGCNQLTLMCARPKTISMPQLDRAKVNQLARKSDRRTTWLKVLSLISVQLLLDADARIIKTNIYWCGRRWLWLPLALPTSRLVLLTFNGLSTSLCVCLCVNVFFVCHYNPCPFTSAICRRADSLYGSPSLALLHAKCATCMAAS